MANRIVYGANQDNTGRIITYDQQNPAYAANVNPVIKAAYTVVGPIALTGALAFNPTTAGVLVSDELVVIFTNGTGGALVVTPGANCSVSGTLSVAAGKKGALRFIFDGSTWVEVGRAATA